MNKQTSFLMLLVFAGAIAGCTRKIHVTAGQAATMSAQAVDTLSRFKVFRLPLLKPSDKMILKMRNQFAAMEKAQLEENKKQYNPAIADTLIGQTRVYIITPSYIRPENRDRVAYYIHGGGYVMGSATDQTGLVMAHELGMKTYSIEYTLAPEGRYPVALDQCLEVYRYLVGKYPPGNITGYSTSAGCGHMIAMLLKAREEKLPMISSIALLSPSLDLSGNGDSYVSNDGRDILALKNQADKFYAMPFTGAKRKSDPLLKDPLISPLYASYSPGFPATVITSSTRDLFLSNSARLYWMLKAAGVPTQLDVQEGMWHAFTVYRDIPEAVAARRSAQDFLYKWLGRDNAGNGTAEERNIALVRTFVDEVINGGNIEKVDELWTKDLRWHNGDIVVEGMDRYKCMLKDAVKSSFTNMHLEILNTVAENDKVMLYFTNSGLNTGAFNGRPATHKYAKWHGMGIYRIAGGKIAEAWFTEDMMEMSQQLGHPAP